MEPGGLGCGSVVGCFPGIHQCRTGGVLLRHAYGPGFHLWYSLNT